MIKIATFVDEERVKPISQVGKEKKIVSNVSATTFISLL
jgi:hypothetical protein